MKVAALLQELAAALEDARWGAQAEALRAVAEEIPGDGPTVAVQGHGSVQRVRAVETAFGVQVVIQPTGLDR